MNSKKGNEIPMQMGNTGQSETVLEAKKKVYGNREMISKFKQF